MQAEYWKLAGDTYVLYTDNQNVMQAARRASLTVIAEYVKGGNLIAVQFSGPKATITEIAKKMFDVISVKRSINEERSGLDFPRLFGHQLKHFISGSRSFLGSHAEVSPA